MKNQFIFNNSNLRNKSDSNVLVNSINKIIRHKTPDHFIPYIELKTLLQNFAAPAVLNNAYRGKEYGENDFDLYITEATTINVYCGFTIYIYKFRIGEINKSGFCYIAEKSIDPIIPDDSCNVVKAVEASEEKNKTKLERTISMKNNIKNNFGIDDATVECIRASLANTDVRLDVLADVFGVPLIKAHDICVAFNCRPVPKSTATEPNNLKAEAPETKVTEVKKPEPELDTMTRMSKMCDYFALNKIFADSFDKFVDESIDSLTSNLINIRETVNSFANPFLNLTAGEIEKYTRPFDNIISLIDIENPDKAAYMIKSAFNALLIAHMDARLNNEDEDFHIEYNVNSK